MRKSAITLSIFTWALALAAASGASGNSSLSECERKVLPLDVLPEGSPPSDKEPDPGARVFVFFQGARGVIDAINTRRLDDALAQRDRSGRPARGPLAPEKFPLKIDEAKSLVRGVFVHVPSARGFKILELPLNASGDLRRIEVRPTTDPLTLLILGYSEGDEKPYRILIGSYCYKVPTNKKS